MLGQEYALLSFVIYFIYGLAFFVMGIALLLETNHSPSLTEVHLLWPLAIFGIIHGLHEWLEFALEQAVWIEVYVQPAIVWTRIALLAISFLALMAYGIQACNLQQRKMRLRLALPLILITIYALLIVFSTMAARQNPQINLAVLVSNLLRYVLAVPAGILTSVGLRWQAKEARRDGRLALVSKLNWAAFGFGIYGLSQLFVSPLAMFPARFINSQAFFTATGIPLEAVRSAAAVIVTIGLVRAIQVIEIERQQQLTAAQEARVEALERVQEELAAREKMRRELLRHTVQAQEDERARISRELHDETAQVLSAFSLELAALRNRLGAEQSDLLPVIDHLQDLSKDMSKGIYRLVHDLRLAQLDDLGLVPAIQNLIERECCNMDLNVALDVKGAPQRVDPLMETVLFRVVQSALTNVSRHARTQQAEVKIRFAPDQVTLRIEDQGVGFSPEGPFIPPSGWGLAGMRERAESVGGTFTLTSSPGSGTSIEIVVPCVAGVNRQESF